MYVDSKCENQQQQRHPKVWLEDTERGESLDYVHTSPWFSAETRTVRRGE